jgi:hypothetical protein
MQAIISLSSQQLRRAAEIKERIESLQNELDRLLGAPAPARAPVSAPAGPKKRVISAAGRARIAAAARARWAKARAAKASAPTPKRKISVAGRARLAALAKERWKKVKAAGKSRL